MRVTIVGAGRVGGTLAGIWSRRGHDVVLTFSRHPEKLEEKAQAIGARAAAPAAACRDADAILFSPPWSTVDQALEQMGDLAGKVLIDATNHFREELPRSGAEVIAAKAPGAHVVKAFNTVFSPVFEPASKAPARASVFFCGNDSGAKRTASELITDAGFEPVDAGGLIMARDIESLAKLVVAVAYDQGRGPFAYKLLPVSELES
jgi:predicted dinucleotide-binding enzyme